GRLCGQLDVEIDVALVVAITFGLKPGNLSGTAAESQPVEGTPRRFFRTGANVLTSDVSYVVLRRPLHADGPRGGYYLDDPGRWKRAPDLLDPFISVAGAVDAIV